MIHLNDIAIFVLLGPTTILIRPDGETIDSFGFDAETRYAELAEDREHKEWYYFKRFKMQLFDKIVSSAITYEQSIHYLFLIFYLLKQNYTSIYLH
jgi:hypothetical protein